MKKIIIGTTLLSGLLFAQQTSSSVVEAFNQADVNNTQTTVPQEIVNNPLQNIEQINNNVVAPQNVSNDFADSLANKIDSKLQNINRQLEEAQQIKNSSLNIPASQMFEEKRAEQFLPVMTGGYEVKFKNSKGTLEKKALTMDEKGQRYYLDLKNNDVVKGLNIDYLVYKNSESNKTFKSPMALPNNKADFKVSATETINSITPVVQNFQNPVVPSAEKVMQDLNSVTK